MHAKDYPGFKKRTVDNWHNQAKRARKYGKELEFSLDDLRAFVAGALSRPCCYCATELTVKNFGIDHSEPVSRSKDFSLSNLSVTCEGCNRAKGDMNDREFTELLNLMAKWPIEIRKNTIARLRAGAGGRFGR